MNSKKDRLYTPAGLQRGLHSLVESLRRLGYREATAVASEVEVDHESGEVRVVIAVDEGRRSVIRESGIEMTSPVDPKPAVDPAVAAERRSLIPACGFRMPACIFDIRSTRKGLPT